MSEVGQVAVEIARLQAEPGMVVEAMVDDRGSFDQTAIITVPARLTDEPVVGQQRSETSPPFSKVGTFDTMLMRPPIEPLPKSTDAGPRTTST